MTFFVLLSLRICQQSSRFYSIRTHLPPLLLLLLFKGQPAAVASRFRHKYRTLIGYGMLKQAENPFRLGNADVRDFQIEISAKVTVRYEAAQKI